MLKKTFFLARVAVCVTEKPLAYYSKKVNYINNILA
jgi:hypothetical protein